MNQRLNEHQSMLQVFLSDKPELLHVSWDLIDFEEDDDIGFMHEELKLINGQVSVLNYYGKNVALRLADCVSNGGDILYSIPEGPVVSFHFGTVNDHYGKFEDGRDRSLWFEKRSRLFWQNREIVVYELSAGTSKYLDLFFRPDIFLEMADRYPVLRELAMEVKTTTSGSLDFFIGVEDRDINALVADIVNELDREGMDKERFQYASECLVLRCMGVVIPFQPRSESVLKDNLPGSEEKKNTSDSDDATYNLYTEEQQKFLYKLQNFDKTELKNMFYAKKLEYFDNKKSTQKYRVLMNKIKARYFEIMGDTVDILADAYFWMAECLDKYSENYPLNDEEIKIVGEAIVVVSDQSFELRTTPHPSHLALYSKWTKKPYFKDVGFDDFSRLINMFIPVIGIDMDSLNDSKESQAIFSEHLQDKFGFKPISHFTGEQEKDKPKEVVELYHMLMQNLSDEFTITEDGEIKKSDLIRILDFAYEMDDLVPMLLIEIEHFAKSKRYVNKQSFDKICLWLLAMTEGNKDLVTQDLLVTKEPLYRLMDLYEGSRQKMKAVEKHALKRKDIYEKLAPALLRVGITMEAKCHKDIFLMLAKSLIIAGENPYK